MEKYKASTEDAKVIGAALKPYEMSSMRHRFESILKKYGLTEIDEEKWYPQQLTLDVQKDIKGSADGGNMLISIGVKIIEAAKFPPMETLEQALGAFASSYPMNFRDQAEEDIIVAEQIDDQHIRVINRSPHSDEMIYGYVYAMVKRFAPEGTFPAVEFEDYSKIDSDGDTAINVTWE